MKKLFSMILAVVTVFTMVACSSDETPIERISKDDVTQAVETVKEYVEEKSDTSALVEAAVEKANENGADITVDDVYNSLDELKKAYDNGEITLQDLADNYGLQDQVMSEIEAVKEQLSSIYSDIDVQFVNNKVIYSYVYAKGFDTSLVQVTEADGIQLCETVKDQIESQSGIRPEEIEYTYYNSDGSIFFTISH